MMRGKNSQKIKKLIKKQKERIANLVKDQLEKVYPGIKDKIEVVDVSTPVTIERYTGNYKGSIMGGLLPVKWMYGLRKSELIYLILIIFI